MPEYSSLENELYFYNEVDGKLDLTVGNLFDTPRDEYTIEFSRSGEAIHLNPDEVRKLCAHLQSFIATNSI